MEVQFADADLDRLETDSGFTMSLDPAIVRAYRKRLQGLRSAVDERDLYAMKSWRLEKLKGGRKHQHSIRLNDQYRLILEFDGSNETRRIVVVSIKDYH